MKLQSLFVIPVRWEPKRGCSVKKDKNCSVSNKDGKTIGLGLHILSGILYKYK